MFRGIVEIAGKVREVEDRRDARRFLLEAPGWEGAVQPGDSVAVDGVCLTVTSVTGDRFGVDVIGTTLERTITGTYREGTRVNLERALRMDQGIDGHLVQGHVDGVGRVIQNRDQGAFWILDVRVPAEVARTTVVHGSIAINGVSLTVSDFADEDTVRIGVIPFTHEHTNLGSVEPGDPVNVEGDLIGKYVGKMLTARTMKRP